MHIQHTRTLVREARASQDPVGRRAGKDISHGHGIGQTLTDEAKKCRFVPRTTTDHDADLALRARGARTDCANRM